MASSPGLTVGAGGEFGEEAVEGSGVVGDGIAGGPSDLGLLSGQGRSQFDAADEAPGPGSGAQVVCDCSESLAGVRGQDRVVVDDQDVFQAALASLLDGEPMGLGAGHVRCLGELGCAHAAHALGDPELLRAFAQPGQTPVPFTG